MTPHDNVLDLIGRTPLVRLPTLEADGVTVLAKLEGQNPAGSVKDRAAQSMIAGAVQRGEITAGTTIVEATSGNTGIALAMIARRQGIPIRLVMPETATPERVAAMRAYGAEVILTDGERGIEHSRDVAQELAEGDDVVMLNQFDNPDNPEAHYRTTGPEIWTDTDGQVTHFVSAMGTTGTIMGTGRYLKEHSEGVSVVGVQPTDGSRIPGIRRWSPQYLPGNYDPARVDQIIDVSREDAVAMTRHLATKEGILAGMSSGGAAHAAQRVASQLAAEARPGVIVTIVCDRGDRYLSSDLFE